MAILAVGLAACGDSPTSVPPPGARDLAAPWTVVAPDEVGIDGDALAAAADEAASIARFRSLVVVRDGRLAFERYYGGWTPDTLADVRSATKSVVSTLVGIALAEGAIKSIDDPITDYLKAPEFPMRPEHGAITIRHLLTMTGGFDWGVEGAAVNFYNEWILSREHESFILNRDITAVPGTTFLYNSAAVHLLGVIVAKATGTDLESYSRTRLFEPLGISRFVWEPLSHGYVNGGAGLDLRPRDLARFGQLMLQKGWSGDRMVVPAVWVREAVTRRFSWTIRAGPIANVTYGFLWWLDQDHGAYFAWGHGGQYVYVLPSKDLVVVATTDWRGANADGTGDVLAELSLGVIVDGVLPTVH